MLVGDTVALKEVVFEYELDGCEVVSTNARLSPRWVRRSPTAVSASLIGMLVYKLSTSAVLNKTSASSSNSTPSNNWIKALVSERTVFCRAVCELILLAIHLDIGHDLGFL